MNERRERMLNVLRREAESRAATQPRWTGVSRVIEVWCQGENGAEKSHEDKPIHIGDLRSSKGPALSEIWTPEGKWVTRQRITDWPQLGERELLLLNRIATKYKLRCPICGFDVTTGDRLGLGWASVEASALKKPFEAERETNRRLAKIAAQGWERLPLVLLGRTVSL